MGKKSIVSVTYENERISIKNSLPYLKCVLRLSCVVHGPIYGRFMGCTVNGVLSLHKVCLMLRKPFFIEMLSFSQVTKTIGFFPYKSLHFERYATMPMLADAHISSLGYLWLSKRLDKEPFKVPFSFCFSLLRIHQKVKSRYLLIRWHSQGLLGPLEVLLLTKRSRYKVYKVHAN